MSAVKRACGGCEGKGSHWRWCEEVIGHRAARRGLWSEKAEAFADEMGANCPEAANLLYHAASVLLRAAKDVTNERREP